MMLQKPPDTHYEGLKNLRTKILASGFLIFFRHSFFLGPLPWEHFKGARLSPIVWHCGMYSVV